MPWLKRDTAENRPEHISNSKQKRTWNQKVNCKGKGQTKRDDEVNLFEQEIKKERNDVKSGEEKRQNS